MPGWESAQQPVRKIAVGLDKTGELLLGGGALPGRPKQIAGQREGRNYQGKNDHHPAAHGSGPLFLLQRFFLQIVGQACQVFQR